MVFERRGPVGGRVVGQVTAGLVNPWSGALTARLTRGGVHLFTGILAGLVVLSVTLVAAPPPAAGSNWAIDVAGHDYDSVVDHAPDPAHAGSASAAEPQDAQVRDVPGGVAHDYATILDFVAPRGAARIGDDVIAAADDAFTHGYKYDPRIRAEGLLDPAGHNFPYSFDDAILRTNPVTQADGSLLYRVPGSIGSKDGFFEIALNTDTGTIFHRSFRGG